MIGLIRSVVGRVKVERNSHTRFSGPTFWEAYRILGNPCRFGPFEVL